MGIELIDPFGYVTRLLEQEFLPLLFARLRFSLGDDALLEDFNDENRHVGDLSMHDIQALHLHICVMLICLVFLQHFNFALSSLRIQYLDERFSRFIVNRLNP